MPTFIVTSNGTLDGDELELIADEIIKLLANKKLSYKAAAYVLERVEIKLGDVSQVTV